MDTVRLFHFDIPTAGNHGDKALFPTVRDAFRGFGDDLFRFTGSSSLRTEVTEELVDTINDTADAVVIGGGGLFLQDTARNPHSGWQWNISAELLGRIEVPLIVFAVGDNRFPGQPEFSAPMLEHVAATLESSVFFGLRNTGSIESMSGLLPGHLRDRIEYQPCPTVLGSLLYPHLTGRGGSSRAIGASSPPLGGERLPPAGLDEGSGTGDSPPTLAVQSLVHRRQIEAGFDAEVIHGAMIDAAAHLAGAGWRILSTPFHPDDDAVAAQLLERVPSAVSVPLAGARTGYLDGYRTFSEVDVALGTRGHAQMIPFGVGAIPVSVGVHDKLGYFAHDLGLPELIVEAAESRRELAQALIERIAGLYDRRASVRASMRARQDHFMAVTRGNLHRVYEAVSSRALDHAPEVSPRPAAELEVHSFGVNAAADAAEHSVRLGWKLNDERRETRSAREESAQLKRSLHGAEDGVRARDAELTALREERDTASRALLEHEAERQDLRRRVKELESRLKAAERLSLSHPVRLSRNIARAVKRRIAR